MEKPNKQSMELSVAISQAKENFLLRTELFAMLAAETKAKFDAFVASGFTPDQALKLCCAEFQRKG